MWRTTGRTTAAGLLVLATLTGCIGGGTTEETSPAPVTSTPVTSTPVARPTTPEEVTDAVVVPKSEFPTSYHATRVDRSLETWTIGLCGYDATDEKRVARVQVYTWNKEKREGATNEAVAYPDAVTAKRALRYNQRLTKYCDQDGQERNSIDDLRQVGCPRGILADAACLRYEQIDRKGEPTATSQTYMIVQVRGKVLTATYANAPESVTSIPIAEAIARKSATRIRELVKP